MSNIETAVLLFHIGYTVVQRKNSDTKTFLVKLSVILKPLSENSFLYKLTYVCQSVYNFGEKNTGKTSTKFATGLSTLGHCTHIEALNGQRG